MEDTLQNYAGPLILQPNLQNFITACFCFQRSICCAIIPTELNTTKLKGHDSEFCLYNLFMSCTSDKAQCMNVSYRLWKHL